MKTASSSGSTSGPTSARSRGSRRRGVVLASIWAQDRDRVLGSGTGMLWSVPADFAHFKTSTMGCPIVMGRSSWEALGGSLPGRTNIVITRSPGFEATGATVVHSLDDALDEALRAAADMSADTVWITGGAHVYAETMDRVDELVITDLDLDVAASGHTGLLVRAPHIEEAEWAPDRARSDADWRPASGDARWRVTTWVRR